MCYRINSDNSGRVTGVSYYGPDGSDNTIEAELVILTPFIYDNTRLLLLSKTEKFPNGLANSSGHVGKHLMAHMMAERVRRVRRPTPQHLYGAERAEAHDRRLQRRQFRPQGLGFIRGSQISIGTGNLQGGPIALTTTATPPGVPRWGAAYRDFLAKYFSRHAVMVAQTENLPYADQTIDLDPNVRDAWGLPAPRLTYDWRRPNELARVEFMRRRWRRSGAPWVRTQVWRAPVSPGRTGRASRGRHAHGQRPEEPPW